jgi:hypothetical protein
MPHSQKGNNGCQSMMNQRPVKLFNTHNRINNNIFLEKQLKTTLSIVLPQPPLQEKTAAASTSYSIIDWFSLLRLASMM